MNNRFKFRAVLKTDTHSIIAEPYYIFDNGYFVNIDDVQKPFENKYPDDCFWEFLEEIEKQENCQEVSTDSEIIIFDSFDGLIQCTGLKDKNGELIYELDYIKYKKETYKLNIDKFLGITLTNILNGDIIVMDDLILFDCEVISNEFECNTKI